MANRRTRSNRRLTLLVVAVCVVLALTLLAGVVSAAHRDPTYRHSVDHSFAAAASAIVESSNVTGFQLATLMADPGSVGRVLLEARLQSFDQNAAEDSEAATRLAAPPPDADAATRLIDTMRLRAEAVATIRTTLEGLLGLTPTVPVGTPGNPPPAAPVLTVPDAAAEFREAGDQLVQADATYHGLPHQFFVASGGASLPQSAWTSPTTGRLMPQTLIAEVPTIANDPRLRATINLSIIAVQTVPLPLPLGSGYPIPPTYWFTAAVSVQNTGSAPTLVTAVIRATPTGTIGRVVSGRTTSAVTADGAVALQLPPMPVVPGEHVLITIDLVRPPRQVSVAGLHWARTVIVAPVTTPK